MNESEQAQNVVRDDLIILIGYRGCGKTSVGRRLAERLGWTFVDTDEEIRREQGRTIADIFAQDGEGAFRRIEAQTLQRVVCGRRKVISVGGGAVLSRRNRKLLRTTGVCVWLTAPPEELYRRIVADIGSEEGRPNLTPAGGLTEIEAVLQSRLPIYEATAEIVVSTSGLDVAQVADAVLDRLRVPVPPGGTT